MRRHGGWHQRRRRNSNGQFIGEKHRSKALIYQMPDGRKFNLSSLKPAEREHFFRMKIIFEGNEPSRLFSHVAFSKVFMNFSLKRPDEDPLYQVLEEMYNYLEKRQTRNNVFALRA